MRFLVDASMSPVVVQELREAGHDAVHVGEVLRLDAPDVDILEHAVRDARVIVAADTDFGDLLAARQVTEPSVVLFHRQTGRRPREQAALLLANLPSVESDLQDFLGALGFTPFRDRLWYSTSPRATRRKRWRASGRVPLHKHSMQEHAGPMQASGGSYGRRMAAEISERCTDRVGRRRTTSMCSAGQRHIAG
jgi:predicted nuclease of predicted toxin-antitoxin system